MRVAGAFLVALGWMPGAVSGQAVRGPELAVSVAAVNSASNPGATRTAGTARTEKASGEAGALTVGDRAVVTLELVVPTAELAGEPRFPTWGKTWGDAEIVSTGPVERSAGVTGETVLRQSITLVAFRPGSVPLPPVAVVVTTNGGSRTISTPAGLALRIASVIPGDPQQAKPLPPAPPRPLPWGNRFWWTFAGLSLAALALGLWVFRRPKTAASAARVLPPLEELEHELARIAANLGVEGRPARIASDLSSALRRYLGRELAFPALLSTTTEIERDLRSGGAPDAIVRKGGDLLRQLDRIKFSRRDAEPPETAGAPANETLLVGAIASARTMATGLDRHLRPAPAPEAPIRTENHREATR